MKRTRVKDAVNANAPADEILVKGWVRTRRDSKGFSFLEINDGSCLKNVQVVVNEDSDGYRALEDIATGAAVEVTGRLAPSPGKGQKWEIHALSVRLVGPADPEAYPMQKKRHSDEYLRTIAHLRPRTNKYGAMFRIRSETAQAVHEFFRERGFHHVHTPILTASDCEGAGEMFRVTNLPVETDPQKNLFGKKAHLTVSGQLSAELLALALGDVYTFGPTFRAENSNTARHAAEFWMIEPEMAFADLDDDMDLAETFLKQVIAKVMDRCAEDIELFARFVDKDLMRSLDLILSEEFVRLPYSEAVEILEKAPRKFEYPVGFGQDLQTEHERYLTEDRFKKPVIVHDYPRSIKPFYMRVNDDGKTVAGMDALLPRVGEIIGGSQREERLDVLLQRIDETGLSRDEYWWYIETRRYGTVPHAGFGAGFERLLMVLTGTNNIRDVIPFPRTPKHLEF